METGPQTSPEPTVDVSIDKVWGDAWAVYKLLFRRSVLMAACIYAFINLTNLVGDLSDSRGLAISMGIAGFFLALVGHVLVQGALVQIVCNVHEARQPENIGELLARAWRHIGSLVRASLIYSLGVLFGLVLLVVPGLLAASRWSLMAPLIMLEDADAGEALDRSNALVRGRTWGILGIVLATFAATTLIDTGVPQLVPERVGPVTDYLISVVASAVTAPFYAHVLTVLYYRITEPRGPVIHPAVHTWRSVWEGR